MTRKEQLEFIARVAAPAQQSQKKHGIPASVTIAQAILESGWGKRAIGNNYFGIKRGAANVPYVEFTTHEYRNLQKQIVKADPNSREDDFRAFTSLEASVRAHGDLIALGKDKNGKLIYAAAMAAVDDPLVFAMRLKECGYATDPNYVDTIARLIKQWNLTQYDEKLPRQRELSGAPQPKAKGATA